ncbi:ABC transporter permease [Virgibacillus sp. DJP39]|uniref:ABC transporter permease n=1 Tax=Virgibacillus sp. DJP39 TaxID=3409790 RepID=UPI003BB54E00
MIVEYIKSAYSNMFRFPNRFWTIIVTVSLATFCLLGLTSMIQTAKSYNQHKVESLMAENINAQQYIVQTASIEKEVDPNQVSTLTDIVGAQSGYYFEDLTKFIWDYDYLIPWINFNDQLIIETKPMMVGLESNATALKEKIKLGGYFTGDPNEIIISEKLLNQFIKSSEVIDGKVIVINDSRRAALKNGEGIKVTPKAILGESIDLVYKIKFQVNEEAGSYTVNSRKSVPLKVVGVYDPKIGYQTPGNVWLPLNLKNDLEGFNSEDLTNNLSGKIALQHNTPFLSSGINDQIRELGLSIHQSEEPNRFFESSIKGNQVRQWMYSVILVSSIILGITCIVVISYLISSERRYEFQLLRALGASVRQVRKLFLIELFFVSGIGSLLGLMISLFVANNTTISEWIGVKILLDGWITIIIVCLLPILSTLIGFLNVSLGVKRDVSFTLKLGE